VFHHANGSGSLEMELSLDWIQIQTLFSFIFKPSQMEFVWKLQILPYSHAILNSHSGMSRQIRILGNLLDFSKPAWTSNKFGSNSKAVLHPGFLIPVFFRILTCFQKESCSLASFYEIANFCKFWGNRRVVFTIYKGGSGGKCKINS
jgi:hypothetical protein